MKYIKNIKLLVLVGLAGMQFAICNNSTLTEFIVQGSFEDLKSALSDPKVIKVNINEINFQYLTPLMLAVRNNRKDMAELLLDRGANPHITPGGVNNTALREAVRLGHEEIIKLLLAKCYNCNYRRAKDYCNTREPVYNYVSALDLNDDSANYERSLGYALIEATKKGRKDLVKLFYDKGAHPNIVASNILSDGYASSNDQTTALIEAIKNNDEDMVKLLLYMGADVNVDIRDYMYHTENTAMIEAAKGGHIDMVKLLLRKGANPHKATRYGCRAADFAQDKGHDDICKLLKAYL